MSSRRFFLVYALIAGVVILAALANNAWGGAA